MARARRLRWILLDWGDTVMRVFPQCSGAMHTWPHVEAMPGAAEVLTSLRGSVLIALVTNADDSDEANIWKALHRGGLGSLFDRVFCAQAIGHRKPSIEFFNVILGELQVGPSVTVMVGDDFEVDVLGANTAGIPAVWFNHRSAEKRSGPLYTTIHDLRDLPQALASLGFTCGV